MIFSSGSCRNMSREIQGRWHFVHFLKMAAGMSGPVPLSLLLTMNHTNNPSPASPVHIGRVLPAVFAGQRGVSKGLALQDGKPHCLTFLFFGATWKKRVFLLFEGRPGSVRRPVFVPWRYNRRISTATMTKRLSEAFGDKPVPVAHQLQYEEVRSGII